jgi:hydroxyquinol 1,2-dioxygenase
MRHIDEDTITQAVIARHAAAGDARLREVMTSLVQHLHAFAREVRLSEGEWARGLRFIDDCARAGGGERRELALLSGALGLSALVAAMERRGAAGGTEGGTPAVWPADAAAAAAGADAEPCFVRGRVLSADGGALVGAQVRVRPSGIAGPDALFHCDADGAFLARCALAQPQAVARDGPVQRLLEALGRAPWRPAHLDFTIEAPGHEPLQTQVFRQGDPQLDADALFGVRRSLVADWVRHAPGCTPDGGHSELPFTTLDFAFVLNATRGDKT